LAADNDRQSNNMYLAEDCKIIGSINSNGNITVDGQVEGTIQSKGDIVIGKTAKVKADIQAKNVSVKGEVHGNISVQNLLEINLTGVVYGDIKTKLVKIEQGAKFIGKSTHIDYTDAESKNMESSNEESDGLEVKANTALKAVVYNRLT